MQLLDVCEARFVWVLRLASERPSTAGNWPFLVCFFGLQGCLKDELFSVKNSLRICFSLRKTHLLEVSIEGSLLGFPEVSSEVFLEDPSEASPVASPRPPSGLP